MSNNLIRKPKVSVGQENPYNRLGFVQNPFPVNPSVVPYSDDIRVNGSIFLESIRQEEIKAFHEHIVNSPNQIGLMMDYLWAVWTCIKEAQGDDFGTYGMDRYTRAIENLKKINL